ncbi:MAG TPA: acetyl-CoA carboxylase biotin carboxylase subunit [bacterium]|nr:acetyl-CoA carboxylase biotin carboxylase subunit [bacterium]
MFDKVLIANRGEIAVRVTRALREMGLRSVAVYSEADRKSLHVLLADEAVAIGPAPASQSYLSFEAILGAAKKSGAQAIHPGYGFLAENAQFAAACRDAGLVFIGPPAPAIEVMGDKAGAKARVKAAGVPVVPGSEGAVGDDEARRVASTIGYPVLLKAAKGGGGKGMRAVLSEREMDAALRLARGEAQSAFGSPELLLEKWIDHPRHVEAQIFADTQGRTVFVGERECSLQRRHQKVVEEAPCTALDEAARARLGEVAVKAAQSAGYVNAGTVEFLLAPDGSFYFLEMNTRIQVEHPVTEETTGVDLVQEQIRVAQGLPLSLPDQTAPKGHAIECRIYAEDPAHQFRPSPGRIQFLRLPQGPGVRNDCGVGEGFTIPVHYDPLLTKIIVRAANREDARRRMLRALLECRIEGPLSNLPYLRWILTEPDVIANQVDTGWLERNHARYRPPRVGHVAREEVAAIAATLYAHRAASKPAHSESGNGDGLSPWVRAGRARMGKRPR